MSSILERRHILLFISICCLISFGACANYTTQQGVQNKWRDESLPRVQIGKTTQAEVAKQFGPPSQVIALNDQVIFYYLLEQKKGKGAFLLSITGRIIRRPMTVPYFSLTTTVF